MKKITFGFTHSMPQSASKKEMEHIEPDADTQGHLQKILEAHEIMTDPVKLKKVHALAGRHKKAITSLQQLKDLTQEKFGKDHQDKPEEET